MKLYWDEADSTSNLYKTYYPFIDMQVIKIISGQRGVGKSYVMMQLMNHIRDTVADANIIYINMEMDDLFQSLVILS